MLLLFYLKSFCKKFLGRENSLVGLALLFVCLGTMIIRMIKFAQILFLVRGFVQLRNDRRGRGKLLSFPPPLSLFRDETFGCCRSCCRFKWGRQRSWASRRCECCRISRYREAYVCLHQSRSWWRHPCDQIDHHDRSCKMERCVRMRINRYQVNWDIFSVEIK